MKLTDELKSKIDAMSYEQLLSRNRFDPLGSPFWGGESGEYAIKAMARKRSEIIDPVDVSKKIGWEK